MAWRRGAAQVLAVTVLATACAGAQATVRYRAGQEGAAMMWTFDADAVGALPDGAEAFSGEWAVRTEPDAPSPPNVLCQSGTAQFPALALGDALYTDLAMSTRFKPISGREDQAAGLI